jgi:hypothetical protein
VEQVPGGGEDGITRLAVSAGRVLAEAVV